MENTKIKHIVNSTTKLHERVAALYEALMDGENDDALNEVVEITQELKNIKADLLTRDN